MCKRTKQSEISQRIIIIWGKLQYRIWNLHRISKSKKKLFKSVHKQEIGLLWSSESFEGKYDIGFGIPIESPSQRKKLFKSDHKQGNWTFMVQTVIWGKYNIEFGIPIKIPSQREKKYSNQSRNNEIELLWSGQSF